MSFDDKNLDIKKEQRSYSTFFILIALIILIIRIAIPYSICRVDGDSMNPNYKSGEMVFAKKLRGDNNVVDRYDVVVSSSPVGMIIKRVVGLPGETVEITKDGNVYINGIRLKEYDKYHTEKMEVETAISIALSEDEYFLIGDNVNHSNDSRSFGPVKKKNLKGVLSN